MNTLLSRIPSLVPSENKDLGANPALGLRPEPHSTVCLGHSASIRAKEAFDRQLRIIDAILRAVEERGR